MSFSKASTVEIRIRELLCGGVTTDTAVGPGLARRNANVSRFGWEYWAPTNIPSQPHEVFVEDWHRDRRAADTPGAFDDIDRSAMEASYG